MRNARYTNLLNLKILIWNACGLKQRSTNLQNFLYNNNIDVALISETHLNPSVRIAVANYVIHRRDRPDGYGGVAVLIKSSITHTLHTYPTSTTMEAVAVKLIDKNLGPLKFIAAYSRPTDVLSAVDYDTIFSENIPTFLGGDLNAKCPRWNSRVENRKGTVLNVYQNNSPDITVIGPADPTHFSQGGGDVLDIAVLKNFRNPVSLQSVVDLNSDHLPVLAYIDSLSIDAFVKTISKTNWSRFSNALQNLPINNISGVSSPEEIDTVVQNFTANISSAYDHATTFTDQTPSNNLDLPFVVKKLISLRNKLRKLWNRTRDPPTKANINNLNAIIKQRIANFKNERWNDKVRSLSRYDNSIWRIMKKLKRSESSAIPPLKNANDEWVNTDVGKADLFAEALASQFTTGNGTPSQEDMDFESSVLSAYHRLPAPPPISIPQFEILRIIKALHNKKTPGPDAVSTLAIKHLPPNYVKYLNDIINCCWSLSYFPLDWKRSNIINIKKANKNSHNPASYRPISLLSQNAKILERTMLIVFRAHCRRHSLIPNYQFGFRARHSCDLQLLRKVETIVQSWNLNQHVIVVYLDIAKAFDTVWHLGLISKLLTAKFPPPLIQLIHSYLSNRSFRVRVNESYSGVRSIAAGVPQGSVLAPALFNFYCHDLPELKNCKLFQYADDTAIMSVSSNFEHAVKNMQKALDLIAKWYVNWKLRINFDKCAAIHFRRSPYHTTSDLFLSGHKIEWCPSYKYLGVTFDRGLTWSTHYDVIFRRSKAVCTSLHCLLGRNSVLSIDNKLLLYKSSILPMLLYGSSAWCTICPTSLSKIQVIQNKMIKIMANAPYYVRLRELHNDFDLDSIARRIQLLLTNLLESIDDHPNPLIRNAIRYDVTVPAKFNRPRHFLLRHYDF